MPHTVQIQSKHWSVLFDPTQGLQIIQCQVNHRDQWCNVMPDCTSESAPLSAANFHMLPYSNRIRDGIFNFEGVEHQLQNAQNHAIHGALRKLTWQVTEQSDTKVCAKFLSIENDSLNWPWPIEASVSYWLDGAFLHSQMTLKNLGRSNMPAGMGWHPYFCREFNGTQPQLKLPVSGVYPDASGDCLPDGPAVDLPHHMNFTTLRQLDPATHIDACFAGLNGPCVLSWPDAGLSLLMQADAECSHLVLFNPDAPYFAVEPVTHANDGFNLEQKGINAGVKVLAPNETLSCSLCIELQQSKE